MQILLVIAVLSWQGCFNVLRRFIVTGALSLIITTAAFWVWPSFGAVAELNGVFPADAPEGLIMAGAFADEMRRLAAEGPIVIRLHDMKGIVAMPSYHTVMACLCLWFSWHTPARWPLFIASVLMVPAILTHGGHHLVDVPAGVAVFAFSLWIARMWVRSDDLPGQT